MVHPRAAKWILKRVARKVATREVAKALDVPTPTEFVISKALDFLEDGTIPAPGTTTTTLDHDAAVLARSGLDLQGLVDEFLPSPR